jgi:putative membrane protein
MMRVSLANPASPSFAKLGVTQMIVPLPRVFALILVLAAAPASAQVQPQPGESPVGAPTTPPERVAASEEDREFAKQAARDLDTEVQVAELATKQARSGEVRDFAERVVVDYDKARQELARAAHLANVEEPVSPGEAGENMITRLDDENTDAFDLTYATQRAVQHKRMVALFEREAKNGQSPPLKRFAADNLPLLQKNAASLDELQKQLVQKRQSQSPPQGK